jgi:hypothetical protein
LGNRDIANDSMLRNDASQARSARCERREKYDDWCGVVIVTLARVS